MKFNIAHVVPNERLHGMHGYKEVIDTVIWGLVQLGHEVTYGLNKLAADSRNIVFGAQVLSLDAQTQLPPDTIIYNFEQMRGLAPNEIDGRTRNYAKNFEVWDYSVFNLETWSGLGLKAPVKIVPVGFAPVLERIPRPGDQDIDVLFYGIPNELRVGAFSALAQSGFKCVFVSGLYGTARDDLIARSKIILNISLYTKSKIFEIVRVSYLFANRKAVVAHLEPDTAIDEDIRLGIAAATPKNLVEVTASLLGNDAERGRIEERGYQAIHRRNIVQILERALDG